MISSRRLVRQPAARLGGGLTILRQPILWYPSFVASGFRLMKITTLRLAGIRCFEDTGEISLSPSCNILIGANNAGKSTLLKGILALQGFPFSNDFRPASYRSFHAITLSDVNETDHLQNIQGGRSSTMRAVRHLAGAALPHQPPHIHLATIVNDAGIFSSVRPNHKIVPFLARRKAAQFSHDITLPVQQQVTGTFTNLYSRIDLVATAGHPRHEEFQRAVRASSV